jgi:histidine ammonia-lyase
MTVRLTGAALSPEVLIAILDGAAVTCDPEALARVGRSRSVADAAAARGPVYGRNTGVGANRSLPAPGGMSVLRSHAGGAGALVPARQARGLMVVRLNQLLAGHAGVHPRVVEALAAAVRSGAIPAVHEYGSVGTGDLTALAETALCLAGERPWVSGGSEPIEFEAGDALAFLSSSALTVARSSLAYSALRSRSEASTVVAALSGAALGSSLEPFAAELHAARPHPGSTEIARRMRALIPTAPARAVQDCFAVRAVPQVDGVLLDALAALRGVLHVELNAAAENPFVGSHDVIHHGGWHQASLTGALDAVRLAALGSAQLSAARLGELMVSEVPFQAEQAGGSGLLVLEYTAASAIAELRAQAMPAALGHAVLSLGVESHASFAAQAARQSLAVDEPFTIVLAAELVGAVRALRGSRVELSATLAQALRACELLPVDRQDRALDGDLETAAGLLAQLAAWRP